MLKVHIRWMIRRDMPEVLAIEADSYGRQAWGEDEFIQFLRKRNAIGMVAEEGGMRIVGFMVYALYPRRIEVVKLAVGPACQRRGVGRQLAQKLILKLSHQRRTELGGWVSDRNLAGHQFLRAVGARAVEVDRDAYRFVYTYQREAAEAIARLT